MIIRQVNKWLKFNQYCQLCDEACGTEQNLCLACEAELPWLGRQCQHCAHPLTDREPGPLCPSCQIQTPTMARVITPWRFAFPIDTLISRFKHHGDWPIGRLLSHYLAQQLEQAYGEGLPKPAALIPVPLSQARLRQRGFDQTRLLADWLGKTLKCPVAPHWIQRVRDTPSQQQLNAQERRHNLQQAFALGAHASIEAGAHFAIIDDVLTTGATAETLAQLLYQAGAARVDLYCLARTPRPTMPAQGAETSANGAG